MESVPVLNDSNVQPGFIYVRDCKGFYPPKEDLEMKFGEIEESPLNVDVTEITLEKFKSLEKNLEEDKLLKKDIYNCLTAEQSFSLLKCSVYKSKRLKAELQDLNIDFEYANIVFYSFDILLLAEHSRKNSFRHDIFHAYLKNFWNGKTDKQLFRHNIQSYFGLKSIKICYRNYLCQRQGFIPPRKAVGEIAAVFKVICENNKLESFRAIVNKLPQRINNKSAVVCDSPKHQTMTLSFLFGFLGLIFSRKKSNEDLKLEQAFQEIQSIMDSNCNRNSNEFDEANKDKIEDNLDCEGIKYNDQSKTIIEMEPAISDNIETINGFVPDKCVMVEKIVVQTDDDGDLIQFANDVEENAIAMNPQASFDDKTKKKIEVAKQINLMMESELNCTKVENVVMKPNPEAKSSAHSVSFEIPKMFTQQSSKMDSETESPKNYFSEETRNLTSGNMSSVKFTIGRNYSKAKLLDPCQTEQIGEFHHRYYKCPAKFDDFDNKTTLLLFGSDECGQLSLVNLICNCSESGENVQPLLDTSSNIEHITYYHFGALLPNIYELTVIVTPKLTAVTMAKLKKHLREGNLICHALGFVVDSRSETLTSEERSFFNFIRSSFGEVSNHYLMAFLTFCDSSRNFSILEEMKRQSIKPKHTFELNNFEVDLNTKCDTLELALVVNDLKKAKKIYKALKEMPLLSVKSMKIEQERSFAKIHLEETFQQLTEELNQFVSNANSGQDFKKNTNFIWKLAKLGLALQKDQSSERDLIQLVAKLLCDIPGIEKDKLCKCFLLLVIYCPNLHISTSLSVILRFHSVLFKASYLDQKIDSPLAVTVLKKDEASIYCQCCNDIHVGKLDRKNSGRFIAIQCSNCECSGLDKILRKQLYDIPKLPFTIGYSLFLKVLLEAFPQYGDLLQTLK